MKKKKTKKEEIFDLLKDGYSSSQIARITGYNRSYVYAVVKKIKDLYPINYMLESSRLEGVDLYGKVGYVSCGTSKGNEGRGASVSCGGLVNVHAHRIVARVWWMSSSYKKNPNRVFKEFVPDVDVVCKGKRIYLVSRKRFHGESEVKAMWSSLSFWERVLLKLQDRLKIVIFKRGCEAFTFVREETETADSVVAKDAEGRGDILRVFHSEDGKLRLSTDRSLGEHNHETHHKRDGHLDSIVFNRFVNSVLDNPDAPDYAELLRLFKANQLEVGNLLSSMSVFSEELNNIAVLLKLLVKSQGVGPSGSSAPVDLSEVDYVG